MACELTCGCMCRGQRTTLSVSFLLLPFCGRQRLNSGFEQTQEKAPSARPDHLSLIPGTHKMDGTKRLPWVVL